MFLLLLSLTPVISAWILFWYLWPRPLGQLMLALERTRAGMRPRNVTSNGIDWHLLAGGHGEPLVLLHGFNADSDHFSRIGRHLNTHFRVIAPDLPGFGLTRYREPLDFSMEAQARRVLELLDVMDIERFYLGGSSMGGLVPAPWPASRHSACGRCGCSIPAVCTRRRCHPCCKPSVTAAKMRWWFAIAGILYS